MVRRETNLNAIVATKAYPRKAPRHTLHDRCSDRAPTFGIGSRAPQRTWGLRARRRHATLEKKPRAATPRCATPPSVEFRGLCTRQ